MEFNNINIENFDLSRQSNSWQKWNFCRKRNRACFGSKNFNIYYLSMKQVLRGARGARQAKYYIRRRSVNNKENFSYNTVKILKMLRGDIKILSGVTR